MEGQQHGDRLKRGLKNRHIQLIALGGAIGTGLFLEARPSFRVRRPGYHSWFTLSPALSLFLIMRQLGEMVVEEPVAGSFSHFAYKYWGGFAGFASSWNLLGAAMSRWPWRNSPPSANISSSGGQNPDLGLWRRSFFIAIDAINLTNVKVFGEMEFWFAIIKVVAVVAMIPVRRLAAVRRQAAARRRRGTRNLWDQGGFLPHGFTGLVMMMAIIMILLPAVWAEWGSPRRKRIIRSKAFRKPPTRLSTVS